MSLVSRICCPSLLVAVVLGQGVLAQESGDAVHVVLGPEKSSITVQVVGAAHRRCKLVDEFEKAQLSHVGSAVIVSDVAYIPMSRLRRCGIWPVAANKIPSELGFLVDVNISAGIYLSLEVVGTSPFAFVATVASLESTKSIVSLPGARAPWKNIGVLREQAFAFDETRSGFIARNGRYVSPGGMPDCSLNAYPGVWDLRKKKRVILTGADADKKCLELFV